RPPRATRPEEQRALPDWSETRGDFEAVSRELSDGFAVLLSLQIVYGAWGTSVIDAEPGRVARTRHAVLAVGFTVAPGPEAVLIKNSWGESWGANGYGSVTRRYLNAYLRRAFVVGRR